MITEIKAAIVLTLLLIYSFYKQYTDHLKSKKQMKEVSQFSMDIPALIIGVEGMTCEHCKTKVENGLRNQPNITNAIADTENNTVKLYGNNLELKRLGGLIVELGYVFKGKVN